MGKQLMSENQRSNRAAIMCYIIMDVILVVSYFIELIKGNRTIGYFAIFSIFLSKQLFFILTLRFY